MRRQSNVLRRPRDFAHGVMPRLVLSCALVLAAGACGEFPTSLTASTRGPFRGGGTAAQSPPFSLALVGEWRRTLAFADDFGGTNVIATLWNFRGDGTFTRSMVQSNLTSGISDSQFATGRWETDGNIVALFFDGSITPQRVTFFFSGAQLVLGGAEYVRVR
jgi:hypothetical protein